MNLFYTHNGRTFNEGFLDVANASDTVVTLYDDAKSEIVPKHRSSNQKTAVYEIDSKLNEVTLQSVGSDIVFNHLGYSACGVHVVSSFNKHTVCVGDDMFLQFTDGAPVNEVYNVSGIIRLKYTDTPYKIHCIFDQKYAMHTRYRNVYIMYDNVRDMMKYEPKFKFTTSTGGDVNIVRVCVFEGHINISPKLRKQTDDSLNYVLYSFQDSKVISSHVPYGLNLDDSKAAWKTRDSFAKRPFLAQAFHLNQICPRRDPGDIVKQDDGTFVSGEFRDAIYIRGSDNPGKYKLLCPDVKLCVCHGAGTYDFTCSDTVHFFTTDGGRYKINIHAKNIQTRVDFLKRFPHNASIKFDAPEITIIVDKSITKELTSILRCKKPPLFDLHRAIDDDEVKLLMDTFPGCRFKNQTSHKYDNIPGMVIEGFLPTKRAESVMTGIPPVTETVDPRSRAVKPNKSGNMLTYNCFADYAIQRVDSSMAIYGYDYRTGVVPVNLLCDFTDTLYLEHGATIRFDDSLPTSSTYTFGGTISLYYTDTAYHVHGIFNRTHDTHVYVHYDNANDFIYKEPKFRFTSNLDIEVVPIRVLTVQSLAQIPKYLKTNYVDWSYLIITPSSKQMLISNCNCNLGKFDSSKRLKDLYDRAHARCMNDVWCGFGSFYYCTFGEVIPRRTMNDDMGEDGWYIHNGGKLCLSHAYPPHNAKIRFTPQRAVQLEIDATQHDVEVEGANIYVNFRKLTHKVTIRAQHITISADSFSDFKSARYVTLDATEKLTIVTKPATLTPQSKYEPMTSNIPPKFVLKQDQHHDFDDIKVIDFIVSAYPECEINVSGLVGSEAHMVAKYLAENYPKTPVQEGRSTDDFTLPNDLKISRSYDGTIFIDAPHKSVLHMSNEVVETLRNYGGRNIVLSENVDLTGNARFVSGYKIVARHSDVVLGVNGIVSGVNVVARSLTFTPTKAFEGKTCKSIAFTDSKFIADDTIFNLKRRMIEGANTSNATFLSQSYTFKTDGSYDSERYAKLLSEDLNLTEKSCVIK